MKHTIVIGGTRGTGRKIAKLFQERGQQVSALGLNSPYDEDLNCDRIKHTMVDITDKDATDKKLKDVLTQYGKVSNLVFSQRYRGKQKMWDGEIATTLTATKNIIEYLLKNNGFDDKSTCSIVLISSIIAKFVSDESPIGYMVAKAGLNQMAKVYGLMLADKNIRVNALMPGTIMKEESQDFYLNNKSVNNLFTTLNPNNRMATSNDIARAVWSLCSEDSFFITGQCIGVDGGLSLRWQETVGKVLDPKTFPHVLNTSVDQFD
jgi:NAD(P)-dependent dehydrogenase (short-subunit alcohol dehydrogenase family)